MPLQVNPYKKLQQKRTPLVDDFNDLILALTATKPDGSVFQWSSQARDLYNKFVRRPELEPKE